MLAFSVFFFLSLAAVKRQAELIDNANREGMKTSGPRLLRWRPSNHLLLDKGAKVVIENNYGHTALDYAKENHHLKGSDTLMRLEEAEFQ